MLENKGLKCYPVNKQWLHCPKCGKRSKVDKCIKGTILIPPIAVARFRCPFCNYSEQVGDKK